MVKLSQTYLQDEDCYEIVNNIRVLQPKYLKGRDRKVFDRTIDGYRQNKLLKRINETFVHQRSIINNDMGEQHRANSI